VSFGAVAPFVLVLGFEVLRGVLGVDFGLVVVVGGGGDVFRALKPTSSSTERLV